jgi:hypothetical protein
VAMLVGTLKDTCGVTVGAAGGKATVSMRSKLRPSKVSAKQSASQRATITKVLKVFLTASLRASMIFDCVRNRRESQLGACQERLSALVRFRMRSGLVVRVHTSCKSSKVLERMILRVCWETDLSTFVVESCLNQSCCWRDD